MSNEPFQLLDLSASGLRAELTRVQVITRNIANANVTQTEDGGPYRRQRVVFEEVLGSAMSRSESAYGGVRVTEVSPDPSPLRTFHDPGHPHADKDGTVHLPNVDLATEMVDLLSARTSYDANLTAMRAFRDMIRQTLGITR